MKSKKAKPSTGLGDSIEKITKATGIDKVAKFILGEDCGCEARKEKLNKLFPYKNAKCLIEEEYNYLKEFFSKHKNTLTNIEQQELLKIFNRVFNAKKESSSCGSCVRDLIQQMKTLYKTYEQENEKK
jgi:NAD(P)H-nitrite reductase large subunit